jgi:hypothetical protein
MAAIGLAALPVHHANAALIAVDLAEIAGADTYLTRDTASGLEWLDVNLTVNTSFSSIAGGAAIANGGALHGLNPLTGAGFASNPFRHATLAEFLTLLSNAAIPDLDAGFTNANYAPTGDLLALIGNSSFSTSFVSAAGFLADVVPPFGQHASATLAICASSHPGCTGAGIAAGPEFSGQVVTTLTIGAGAMHPNVAHFLVRSAPSAIPEPASAVLMIGALAALTGLRRRRGNG